MFGKSSIAQTLKLRPSLALTSFFNELNSNTIPEPSFSTIGQRSADAHLTFEHIRKNNVYYLKVGSYTIGNVMRHHYDEKPEFLDFLFGSSTLKSSSQSLRIGVGLKTDLRFNNKDKSLFGVFGISGVFQPKADTIGTIQGPYSPNLIIEDWKTTFYKSKGMSFEIGLAHWLKNNRGKEIVEISITYNRCLSLMHQKTLYYKYSGPRYGSNAIQKATFNSYGSSVQIIVSKAINLIK